MKASTWPLWQWLEKCSTRVKLFKISVILKLQYLSGVFFFGPMRSAIVMNSKMISLKLKLLGVACAYVIRRVSLMILSNRKKNQCELKKKQILAFLKIPFSCPVFFSIIFSINYCAFLSPELFSSFLMSPSCFSSHFSILFPYKLSVCIFSWHLVWHKTSWKINLTKTFPTSCVFVFHCNAFS